MRPESKLDSFDRTSSSRGSFLFCFIFMPRRWVDGLGLQLLAHAITVLEIDVVLVMKHDRLYADMVATLPRSVAVINLPRSGGAV